MNSILDSPWHHHVPKEKPSAGDLRHFSGQKVGSHGERGAVMLCLPVLPVFLSGAFSV